MGCCGMVWGLGALDMGYGGRQSCGDIQCLLEAAEVMQRRVVWICGMLSY